MVKSQHRILSVVLSVLMVLGMLTVLGGTITAGAASAGVTVYYDNSTTNWNSVGVYCYGGNNMSSPTAMTKVTDNPNYSNLWKYTTTQTHNYIIFVNGTSWNQGQTKGDNATPLLDNSATVYKADSSSNHTTVSTSEYIPSGNEPTNPTTPTSPTSPTSPTTPSGDGAYAYLANTANWSNPTVYAWKTESEKAFGNWPGKKLTDADKDAAGNYQVYIPEEYIGGGVVFSDNGNSKSLDLDISSGESKIYDNSARTWLDYDTSALKFKSFSTDIASPQYKGTDITISAEASGGEGTISYKFSVKSASSTTVLSDFSATKKSVIWTPQTAGTYTIIVDIKDTAGNENSKSISYVIEDDELSVKPVLKGVTPVTGSEIEANKAATVEVKASGGKVGTNLLFYKVAVKDPDGNAVNTVYYKTSPKLTFTPSKLGTYTIDVSVQNSENTTVTKTYTYKSVGQLTPVEDPLVTEFTVNGADEKPSVVVSTSATITARGAQGTQPYTYQFAVNGKVEQAYSSTNSFVWTPKAAGTYTIEVTIKDANNKLAKKTIEVTVTDAAEFKRGDVDMNGTVNMNDVLLVQKYLAKITTLSEEQLERARITHTTGDPVMNDVLQIQKYLAKIVSEL